MKIKIRFYYFIIATTIIFSSISLPLKAGKNGPDDLFGSMLDSGKSIGFGFLQLSYPTKVDDEKAKELLKLFLEKGGHFIDTAAVYGENRHNEKLLGKCLQSLGRQNFVIATKCGIDFDTMSYTQSPKAIRDSLEESLKSLAVDSVDVLYLHRIDPDASQDQLAATIRTMKELVKEGRVKRIGLSEPSAEQIRFCHGVEPRDVPISTVESAYSIAARRVEDNGVLDTCKELGILFVAYTPVVRGMVDERLQKITASDFKILSDSEFQKRVFELLNITSKNDSRRDVGWFLEKNIKHNVGKILAFHNEAKRIGCSPSQLALAWLAKKKGVMSIPATTNPSHLSENMASLGVELSPQDIETLDKLFSPGTFLGNPNPLSLSKFDPADF